jgi:Holliday junction resolvase-like predicted endonuclease
LGLAAPPFYVYFMNNIELGRMGEEAALQLLLDKGYKLVAKNFRNKIGEIDLVMRDGGTVVGIEVKAKREGGIEPSEMLTSKKIAKVTSVLNSMAWDCQSKRVECVTVLFDNNNQLLKIEHFDDIS